MRVRRPLSNRSKLLASVALAGLLLAAVAAVVQSAFTSTVRNPDNSFAAGQIELSGSLATGSALFDLRGLTPGSTVSRCIAVSYSADGDIASSVRLWGRQSGELAKHLNVKVLRGAFDGAPTADGSCTGFIASLGAPPLYHGTLAAFPASYAAGVVDTDTSWTDGESAVFRIDVEVADRDEAQGTSATHELVFEARTN